MTDARCVVIFSIPDLLPQRFTCIGLGAFYMSPSVVLPSATDTSQDEK